MDYEKLYKEALERAKDFMNGEAHYELKMGENIMCWIFPELRESEDEKIRKWLLNFVQGLPDDGLDFHFYNLNKEQVVAWLEKQNQVKESQIFQHENKTCKENDDSLTSEDEKIRKELIRETKGSEVRLFEIVTNNEFVSWLEKQGQKPAWSEEDEAHINSIIDYLLDYKLLVYEEDMNVANGVQKELDWLNSLKQSIGG